MGAIWFAIECDWTPARLDPALASAMHEGKLAASRAPPLEGDMATDNFDWKKERKRKEGVSEDTCFVRCWERSSKTCMGSSERQMIVHC